MAIACWICAIVFLPALCGVAIAADGPKRFLEKPDAWFAGDEAKDIAAKILNHQSPLGGWPKNIDTTAPVPSGERPRPTFDNGATTDELRYLARIFNATRDERYREAFAKGLNYILQAQYANGGWPQCSPAAWLRALHHVQRRRDGPPDALRARGVDLEPL